jgi:hypothetical protein
MGDERKPLWPWIVALLIGLPVLYVVSFGPACWVSSQSQVGGELVSVAYQPILRIALSTPVNPAKAALVNYGLLFSADGWYFHKDSYGECRWWDD